MNTITNKEILEEAPLDAVEYVYESRDQLAGYMKANRTQVYTPEFHDIGWQEHKAKFIDKDEVVVQLKDLEVTK